MVIYVLYILPKSNDVVGMSRVYKFLEESKIKKNVWVSLLGYSKIKNIINKIKS